MSQKIKGMGEGIGMEKNVIENIDTKKREYNV